MSEAFVTATAITTCKNVTLAYESNIVAKNRSFSVEAGDYLYIIGENGSGKTTLMKAMPGFKPVASGSIEPGDGLSHVGFGAMVIAAVLNIAPINLAISVVVLAAFIIAYAAEFIRGVISRIKDK
ncbi:MAG: ATP-binding cassette domain-containing protein [Clostridiales bacterium]|nr:ATP-binding cassette domain-containing protein [Clostridiales bacterium]